MLRALMTVVVVKISLIEQVDVMVCHLKEQLERSTHQMNKRQLKTKDALNKSPIA